MKRILSLSERIPEFSKAMASFKAGRWLDSRSLFSLSSDISKYTVTGDKYSKNTPHFLSAMANLSAYYLSLSDNVEIRFEIKEPHNSLRVTQLFRVSKGRHIF